jgi:hypothetical protein
VLAHSAAPKCYSHFAAGLKGSHLRALNQGTCHLHQTKKANHMVGFFSLVESPKTWKNRSKLSDSFEFTFGLKSVAPQKPRDSHEKQALSVAQIAELYRLDKDSGSPGYSTKSRRRASG